jgi:hypothetical protein
MASKPPVAAPCVLRQLAARRQTLRGRSIERVEQARRRHERLTAQILYSEHHGLERSIFIVNALGWRVNKAYAQTATTIAVAAGGPPEIRQPMERAEHARPGRNLVRRPGGDHGDADSGRGTSSSKDANPCAAPARCRVAQRAARSCVDRTGPLRVRLVQSRRS